MWYLIEGHKKEKRLLLDANIACMEVTVSEPRYVSGLSFPEAELENVVRILGLPAHTRQQVTDRTEIVLVEPVEAICQDDSDIQQLKVVQKVLTQFAQKWRKSIYYSNPHGRYSSPEYEVSALFVRFYSTPEATIAKQQIGTLFGIELSPKQAKALLPVNAETVEVLFDGETAYAQIFDTTLYILCDLPDTGTNIEKILTNIMLKWEPFVLEELGSAEFVERRTKDFERSRQAYLNLCAQTYQVEIKKLRKKVADAQEEIAAAKKRIVESTREKDDCQALIEQLESNTTIPDQRYLSEYELLCSNPKVERIRVTDSVVYVYTAPLVTKPLKRDGTIRDLGKYLIQIATSRPMVTLINLTRTVGDKQHPHASSEGGICLGNMETIVPRLIGEYKFAQLIHLMIKFIENPNEEDAAGAGIYKWPIAST